MSRLLRYLTSTSNLVGSAAALAVLGAYFAGFVEAYWWLLVVGAYAAGALPFAFREQPVHTPEGLSTQESLDWLKGSVMPRLPTRAGQVLADIIRRVEELMPRLKEMETQGVVEASNRNLLKQTVTRYLPDAVESFLKLPASYTRVATKAAQGKSAEDLLVEQLVMLQEHVTALEENVLTSDVNKLLANGRFLQEKFQKAIDLDYRR